MKIFGPFVEMARLQNEINRIFGSLLEVSPEDSLKVAAGWVPSVDVVQAASILTVKIELPGVDPEHVELAVGSAQITVRGEKTPPASVRGARYHCLERGHGPFSRTVHLPVPVNTHKAQAVLREGLLTVSFPRVSNRRGQLLKIPVVTE
ncbi:MAG: Hsp20/alpha crystallin family protein [Acidobacteriota bacterium]